MIDKVESFISTIYPRSFLVSRQISGSRRPFIHRKLHRKRTHTQNRHFSRPQPLDNLFKPPRFPLPTDLGWHLGRDRTAPPSESKVARGNNQSGE